MASKYSRCEDCNAEIQHDQKTKGTSRPVPKVITLRRIPGVFAATRTKEAAQQPVAATEHTPMHTLIERPWSPAASGKLGHVIYVRRADRVSGDSGDIASDPPFRPTVRTAAST